MKSIKRYIPSLLVSVLLVFSMILTSVMTVVSGYAKPEKLVQLTEDKGIISMIKSELDRHFSEKYNETGVPAEVYTAALSDEYIESILEMNINAGFSRLDGSKFDNKSGIENPQLEESVTSFFSNYADSIGYVKDDVYEQKLQKTIESAYNIISDYCDVYKFSLLNSEGLLAKGAKVYPMLDIAVIISAGIVLLCIILLLLINRREKLSVIYWAGNSLLIAGILGIAPCVYLNSEKYFDAFVLKQPQVFTSFTGLLYDMVDSVMTNLIITAIVGIVLIIAYTVISRLQKKSQA